MCAPAAIMAVTAGVNIVSDTAAANAKDKQATSAWTSAQSDLMGKYNATQLREQQEAQRTQLQVIQAQRQGRSNASKIRAQAAGNGAAGASITEREDQPGIAVTDFTAEAKLNLAAELRQNQADAAGYLAQAKSTINENQPESGLAYGLSVAKDAAAGAENIAGASK